MLFIFNKSSKLKNNVNSQIIGTLNMSNITNEWPKIKLSEICDVIMGQSPKSEYYNSSGKGLPFLQGNRTFGYKYPKFDTYTTCLIKTAQSQDVIMSVRAPVGDLNITPVKMCLGRGVCAIHMKNNNQEFLFYLMKYYVPNLISKESGTVFGSINKNDIENLEVYVPNNVEIQKKIAAVLSALDDKIELNNKINQNLEQQAQAIFKSWFIDFEPFGGKMPDDWRKGKLKDILRLKKKSIKPKENKLPYLPIDIIPMHNLALKEFKSHSEAKSSLITFDKDDILIGAMRVYFHRVVIAPCKGVTRTTCFILSPFDNNCLIYGLMLCNQNEAIKYAQKTSKGSTMPYAIWDGGLGDLKIIIPSQKILNDFNTSLLPCIKKIQNSYFENLRLAQLRDALLPKLMSGEVDVSKINIDDFENKILGEKND